MRQASATTHRSGGIAHHPPWTNGRVHDAARPISILAESRYRQVGGLSRGEGAEGRSRFFDTRIGPWCALPGGSTAGGGKRRGLTGRLADSLDLGQPRALAGHSANQSPVLYPGSTACSRTCFWSSGRHPLGWVLGEARQRGSHAIRRRVEYCSRCGAVPYGATTWRGRVSLLAAVLTVDRETVPCPSR